VEEEYNIIFIHWLAILFESVYSVSIDNDVLIFFVIVLG